MNTKAVPTTDKLIALCQNGEREAQSFFYQKYRHEVVRTVYKVLGPDVDLEDVVQDVFIEVFRSIDKFKGQAKITTWLYRVCVNIALQKIRQKKRRPEGYLAPAHEVPIFETPQRSLERKESSRLVYELLESFSHKKRTVFILHEIMGMDSKEIAKITETNVLTVRTRLHYARREFYEKALRTPLCQEERA